MWPRATGSGSWWPTPAPLPTLPTLPTLPHAPHPPHAPPAEGSRPLLTAGGDALEVLDPGIATTVQDLGRTGVSGLGVPTAGAADRRAHTLANLLVGNDPGAASVECTAVGPVVRMVGAGHVAVVGCGPDSVEVTLDGRPVPDGVVLPVADGQVVRVGRITRGLRAYLAVAGGFDTPVVLGSRSSDVLAGLGHGPLHAGDRLARDAPARVRGRLTLPPVPSGPVVLRVVAGPHAGPGDDGEDHLRRLIAHRWRVGSAVDRVGVRLLAVGSPAPLPPVAPAGSVPMVTGAVQLPPDGDPIVLLPDHATVGGYPVVACVVSADLPRLGQLAPDARVAFTLVDTAEAVAALAASRDEPASLVSGWFPTGAGT